MIQEKDYQTNEGLFELVELVIVAGIIMKMVKKYKNNKGELDD